MEGFREKGAYYDVPADNIDLGVEYGKEQPSYDPMRYMKKQRQFAKESDSQLSKEAYKDSRYS